MNWLDIIILVLLGIAVFAGLRQGLIRAVLSLAGLILGIVLASNFYQQVGGALGFISNSDIANIVAFIIILFVVMAIAAVVATLLRTILKAITLGWVDRLGGVVFGLLMGVLFISALLAIIVKYAGPNFIAASGLAGFFLDKFPIILGFLPSEFDGIQDFFK